MVCHLLLQKPSLRAFNVRRPAMVSSVSNFEYSAGVQTVQAALTVTAVVVRLAQLARGIINSIATAYRILGPIECVLG